MDISIFTQSLILYIQKMSFLLLIQILVFILGIIQIYKIMFDYFDFLFSVIHKQGMVEGMKYSYHFTRFENYIQFREIQMNFRRNFRNQLIIKAKDTENNFYYKGIAKIENDQLLFLLESESFDFLGNKHKEEIQLRFFNYSQFNEGIVYGFWIGRDLNKNPMCGIRLLSSIKLSESQVVDLIKERTIITEGVGMLTMGEHSCLGIDNSENTSPNSKNVCNNGQTILETK